MRRIFHNRYLSCSLRPSHHPLTSRFAPCSAERLVHRARAADLADSLTAYRGWRGKDREVQSLLADPARKLVLIRLRNGALLDDHSARFPITIQGVAGKGTLRVGNAAYRLCTRDGCAGRRSSRSQRSGRACNSRLVLSASRIAGRQRHDSALRLEAVSTYRQWPKHATAY